MTNNNKTASFHGASSEIFTETFVQIGVFTALAIYLLYPYFSGFRIPDYLHIFNFVAGATGASILSRRYIATFAGTLIVGLLYSFSPFTFSLASYNLGVTIPMAILPWLFCPAAFAKGVGFLSTFKRSILALLPFVFLGGFFLLLSQDWFLPNGPKVIFPIKARATAYSIGGIISPQLINPNKFIISFYHIGIILILIGGTVFINAKRVAVISIFIASVLLTIAPPMFEASPVIWVLVITLFCSVLAGIGVQTLEFAGQPDCKTILYCAIAGLVAALLAWLITFKLNFLNGKSACMMDMKLHLIAGLSIITLSSFILTGLRSTWIRSLIVIAAVIADIIFTAPEIINKVF